jgi:hypothetical protein
LRPEPWFGPWNAHIKDKLENNPHVQVCRGQLSLRDAQQSVAIASVSVVGSEDKRLRFLDGERRLKLGYTRVAARDPPEHIDGCLVRQTTREGVRDDLV